ncbi:DUF5067 domain-containing protein [Pediococcus acidilactici]|uniref:DUF5067 domain-containing protein n=1 Tax=Pediococcus acidilactici TaxID=1254 RepID=UPI003F281C1C
MKKSLTLGTVIMSVVVLSACGNNATKKDSPNNTTENVAKPKTEKYYFKNDELKIHDLKIKITNSKIIPAGKAGNEYGEKPVLAIWYKVTNLTNKEIDPNTAWMSTFEAYQDNNKNRENKLNVGSLPDQRFIDSQQDNIKKNGTVENAVSYELDDNATPVTLKATQGLGGKKLGTKIFKIKEVLNTEQSDLISNSNSTSSTISQSSSTVKNTSETKQIAVKSTNNDSQSQQAAVSSSSEQTLSDFVNEHGMSPAAYKMQHDGMSEKEALDSTPRGMKSSGEIQMQNELNKQQ